MEFTKIKQLISDVSTHSVIFKCLVDLHTIQSDKLRKYPHWKYLVLIKWAYQYGGDNSLPAITPDQWSALQQAIDQLETTYLGLSFSDATAVRKSFRILAFQQFTHQEGFHKSIISRQVTLYLFTKTYRLDIAARFEELTALRMNDFFRYCFFLAIYFTWESSYELDAIDTNFLKMFTKQYGAHKLERFLGLITIRSKEDVDALQKMNKEQLQLYETNFFVSKPLLFFMGNYILPHQSMLTQTLKHLVYTYMKANDPGFCDELGKRMEDYLEMGLREAAISYKREDWLKREFGSGKVVDFLVEDSILIECKATELHPRSGVLRSPEVLAGDLQTSVVKGYFQLVAMASRMPPPTIEWFGVIVTYKEMYLGFGDDAWDEFLEKPLTEMLKKANLSNDILPPGNLFFISLEDWDHAMQVVKEGHESLRDILTKGRELNHHPSPVEQVFILDQVLQKHFPIEKFTLSYLTRAESEYEVDIKEDSE